MAELLVLRLFAVALFLSIGIGVPLLVALLFGLVPFFGYGLYKKHSFRQLFLMALTGTAFFLYLLPLWTLITELFTRKNRRAPSTP